MKNDRLEWVLSELRDDYNVPPETPREEMWAEIQSRLDSRPREGESSGMDAPTEVFFLEAARRSRLAQRYRTLQWAGAAAAILILGLAIGRMTAPGVQEGSEVASETGADPDVLRVAAMEHLLRTESLLTLVRADARAGRIEASVGSWARTLLTETRLLMDAQGERDPVMARLLEDLELVLMQIVGATNADGNNEERVRSELNLALAGIEEREVLPRIQAVVPAGPGFLGT